MSTDVSEVRAATIIIALMMEAARTSETTVDIQTRARQYIPEDSELHEITLLRGCQKMTEKQCVLILHMPYTINKNYFWLIIMENIHSSKI
jgi:hypothetical protein